MAGYRTSPYCKVGSDRSKSKAKPDKKVRKVGEPLGEAIAQNDDQCHRSKKKTQRVQEPGCSNKQNGIYNHKNQGASRFNYVAWYLPDSRARILFIKFPVGIPVETHGGIARKKDT